MIPFCSQTTSLLHYINMALLKEAMQKELKNQGITLDNLLF